MIRLGILDFDTSHCVEFTKRLNHTGTARSSSSMEPEVVIGCAGESKLSPERIEGFTKQMKEFGVPLVDKPADMIGKVDGMLIEVGGRHRSLRAREAVPRSRHPVLHRQAVHLLGRRREEDRRAGRSKKKAAGVLVVVAAVRSGGRRVRRPIRNPASWSGARCTARRRSRRSRSATRASSTTASTPSRCSTR